MFAFMNLGLIEVIVLGLVGLLVAGGIVTVVLVSVLGGNSRKDDE